MAKQLAGYRAFEAMGRSANSRGMPLEFQRAMRAKWPMWARRAWTVGWLKQGTKRIRSEDAQ